MSSYGVPAGTPEYQRAWKQANRKKISDWRKQDYAANPEKYKAADRRHRATPNGREAARKRSARHNPKRGLKHRRWRLQKEFGITVEQYESMLIAQNNGCAICHSPTPRHRAYKYFCIDHCHSTNVVRGLLCNDCNVGIGRFNDSPERLQAAIAYLTR